jgi:murein DD-endopeptidase MepM/ murein hydrolase activator NlpD
MRIQRHLRLIAGAAALIGAVSFGLADWSSSSSPYVVQPGDTLWSIATSHGLTVAQLASANRLNPADILPIGLHLYVPSTSTRLDSVSISSHQKASPWTFCADFIPSGGPYGVLPSGLAGTATYYQLTPLFQRWASYYGVSLPLLEAIAWQESGWQEGVVSPTGAIGVGQVEPYTATFISEDLVGERLDPRSVSDNIRMSAAFVAYLSQVEGNNRCATIAAYYEGPLNLQAMGVLPDTQQYVADVEALLPEFE